MDKIENIVHFNSDASQKYNYGVILQAKYSIIHKVVAFIVGDSYYGQRNVTVTDGIECDPVSGKDFIFTITAEFNEVPNDNRPVQAETVDGRA